MSDIVRYALSFTHHKHHYVKVEVEFAAINEEVVFSLPVWTPGSYLIREFARHIEELNVTSNGKKVTPEKISKNTWSASVEKGTSCTISYRVYANELSVRTSKVTDEFAYLNGTNVFFYIKGFEGSPCEVNIKSPPEWKKTVTGLNKISEGKYYAENYDELADCPIFIGNPHLITFTQSNKNHTICINGEGNYDDEKLLKDFSAIVKEEEEFFGSLPYNDFTFFINLTSKSSGGLEHRNSFTAEFDRWGFTDEKKYKRFLSLVSHELFHVWNVKRIRPVELGPFQYDLENYTKNLWVSEGWTSFYDNIICLRAGLYNEDDYLEYLEKDLNAVLPYKGHLKQSLEDSSYDAWIKLYRKNENFENTQISYYNKGALTALCLNLLIIKESNYKRSLDDALRYLWRQYLSNPDTGFTSRDIIEACSKTAEKDISDFFNSYVSGLKELPLTEAFKNAGIEIEDINESKVSLGIELKPGEESAVIAKVFEGGTGFEIGLSSEDVITSVNGISVSNTTVNALIENYGLNDEVEILVSRDGLTRRFKGGLKRALPKFKLSFTSKPDREQLTTKNKWFYGRNEK